MWQDMMAFLESWFIYPGLAWDLKLIGIALGLVFGVLWLLTYWPPVLKRYWLVVVLAGSAFLGVMASTFVQMPLQIWIGKALSRFWDIDTLYTWLLLAGIPQVLLSGLVQEGAKMVPIVIWWWRAGKEITPKFGLIIGAFAGAGLGIFEAVWAHCRIFGAGWTTQAIQSDGFLGIAGFWERFFVLGFHVAVSAIVGYGLARGKGWQTYLIAAGLHTLLNYGAVVYSKGHINVVQLETFVAVFAVIVSAVIIWLRWERSEEIIEESEADIETVTEVEEDAIEEEE
jgi:RsiW-degrading membrane proteinase PrsW (M82 family)